MLGWAGLGWGGPEKKTKGTSAWDKASQQQATGQPASQPASLCVPVGWAGNVSESKRFRTKSNTILVDDHLGISAGWVAGWLVSIFPPFLVFSLLLPHPSSLFLLLLGHGCNAG